MKDDYELTNYRIGGGTYGDVYIAKKKDTGEPVAMKIIKKDKTDMKSLAHEVTVLRNCQHENIIRFIGYFERNEKVYIITELAQGGELFDQIIKRRCFSESDARLIVKQIISALVYLHHNGVAHLDLKPENILLKRVPFFYGKNCVGFTPCIKLADFGTAAIMRRGGQNSLVGTPGYIAPEVIQRQNYTYEPDVYSLGVVTYVLLSGSLPFPGKSVKQIVTAQVQNRWSFNDRFTNVSTAAKEFITQCLAFNPGERPTMKALATHRWLTQEQVCTELLSSVKDLRIYTMTIRLKAGFAMMIAARRLAQLAQVMGPK